MDFELNPRVLDAAYNPFPPFQEWASRTEVDTVRWERYYASLQQNAGASGDVLNRAREIAKRAAALDTGAIEGLYDVDRGFTYTVALEKAAWEAALNARGEQVRPLFEAQLHAYDYVLDLATKAEPISEAAIRTLHEEVCRAQSTYDVQTAIGPQKQSLPKGLYKALPNHVRTRKGTDHSYAPVDMTPPEMARLVGELRGEGFQSAHPVLQSAYVHYGLVAIHPFADGNGRVARALASAFTYKAIRMPIVILSEHKQIYFEALESADSGEYQIFVDFILTRALDTIELVDQSVRSALVPTSEQSVAGIDRLYLTKGGYTHKQVDEAADRLINAVKVSIERAIARNRSPNVSVGVNIQLTGYPLKKYSYRLPVKGGHQLIISLGTNPPVNANASRIYNLLLPKDPDGNDDVLVSRAAADDEFAARMDQLVPAISGVVDLRINMFGEQVVNELMAELKVLAVKALGTRLQ